MKKHALGVAAALACLALPAQAQERFAGVYLGGFAGYSYYDVDWRATGLGAGRFSADGIGAGGFVGWGLRNGALYGGLEAEIGYDGAERDETVPGGTATVEGQLSGGLAFRAGAVIAERFMPYIRVGWQYTEYKASATGLGSDSDGLHGLRAGAGLEMALGDSLSARAEYSYTMYEKWTDVPGLSVEPDQHLLRLGLAFHF